MNRGVTFDVWHTLVFLEPTEEEDYLRRQEETVAAVIAGWPRSPRARHPPTRDPRAAARFVFEEAAMSARKGISRSISSQAVRAGRLLGRIARPQEYARALDELVERTEFRICSHAQETLTALHESGARIGVVSNTVGEPGGAIQRLLERSGLGDQIGSWAFSDQLPWTKPAPEIFWHCLRAMGIRPEQAVHVGDGPSDLVGARRADLRAGILYTGARQYSPRYQQLFAPESTEIVEAEFRIDSLAELPDLIDRLLPVPVRNGRVASGSGF